jgi:hypothetical protein
VQGSLRRADARTRTGDPFITSEVLYQLSYVGGASTVTGSRRVEAVAAYFRASTSCPWRYHTLRTVQSFLSKLTGHHSPRFAPYCFEA